MVQMMGSGGPQSSISLSYWAGLFSSGVPVPACLDARRRRPPDTHQLEVSIACFKYELSAGG